MTLATRLSVGTQLENDTTALHLEKVVSRSVEANSSAFRRVVERWRARPAAAEPEGGVPLSARTRSLPESDR